MLGLDFKATKAGFFDRKAVIDKLDKATRTIFSKFGSVVRKTAQKSLKYGKKPSAPGTPPTAHRSRTKTTVNKKTGKVSKRPVSYLREYIYFAFDQTAKSVVIGPSRLNSTVDPGALPALEYSGTVTIKTKGKSRRASIAARPFMRPAAAEALPTLPPMWRDSVR